MMDQNKAADLQRVPFIKKGDGWNLFLVQGKSLSWGHRFDEGIGYRVFIKFADSLMTNSFPAGEARRVATRISRGESNEDILNIGIHMKRMADEVDRLNKIWAAKGAPDKPLHELGGEGHV